MEQEDKQLLLKDLSARLTYEVKVDHFGSVKELLGIIPSSENVMVGYDINDYEDSVIEDIKPYLRSMSSMTEREKEYYYTFIDEISIDIRYPEFTAKYVNIELIDEYIYWLNAHHFDYRGLIERGFALEAPKGMYN